MPTNNVFRIDLPPDWTDRTIHTYEGPEVDGVKHNLTLVVDPKVVRKIQLDIYAKQQMANFYEVLPGYQLLQEREIVLPNGMNAYEVVFKTMPKDEVVRYQKQMYLIVDGKGYIFSSTFSKKTFKIFGQMIDSIISSFELVEDDRE